MQQQDDFLAKGKGGGEERNPALRLIALSYTRFGAAPFKLGKGRRGRRN
ncbi:MAG: hypothetical protein JEZ02_09460 [Desulfatibacillum sp.]|nr:hypothetical protein [Desulfatibacillum sp.]